MEETSHFQYQHTSVIKDAPLPSPSREFSTATLTLPVSPPVVTVTLQPRSSRSVSRDSTRQAGKEEEGEEEEKKEEEKEEGETSLAICHLFPALVHYFHAIVS